MAVLFVIVQFILIGGMLAFIPPYPPLGRVNFFIEVNESFSNVYAILLALSALYLILVKAWRSSAFAIVFCCLHLATLLPREKLTHAAPREAIKVLYANVWIHNSERGRVKELVERLNPDIVALAEVDQSWLRDLSLENQYKYSYLQPGRSADGGAIYSRLPLSENERIPEGGYFASLFTKIELSNGMKLPFYFIHAPHPQIDPTLQSRDELFELLAKHVQENRERALVLGDFNTAFSSYSLSRYRSMLGLHDAGREHMYRTTWRIPQYPFVRTQIDHVFYGSKIMISNFEVGADIGSDHFPLFFELSAL